MMLRQCLGRKQVTCGRSLDAPRITRHACGFRSANCFGTTVPVAGTSPKQRIAIVTGGAQGLGEAISRALANGGDKVVIADMLDEQGRKVADSVGGSFVHCDVSDSSSVESLITGVAATHGSVDVVVANAGIAPVPKAMHTISDEEWHKMILINGFGTFATCKHAVRQMLKQEHGGVILGMASVCGMNGHTGTAAYNFTKAGIVSLTKTTAIEYRKRNIRMNCLCPTTTETPLVKTFIKNFPPELADNFRKINPVPGLMQPSHVAQAAAMLCAPNKFLTGVAMPIDGGYLACAPTYMLTDWVTMAEEAEK